MLGSLVALQLRRLGTGVDSVFSWLGNIPPLVYLIIYLLAIPGFASAYRYFTRNEFYAPNAKMEPQAKLDATRLSQDIVDSIGRSIDQQVSTNSEWSVDKNRVSVHSLHADADGTIRFELYSIARRGSPVNFVESGDVSYIVPLRGRAFGVDGSSGAALPSSPILHEVQRVQDNLDPSPELSEVTNRLFFSAPGRDVELPVLAFDRAQEQHLSAFELGSQGDASSFSGSWWRLAYFSAMTITTVGYGDIVPLSGAARALAAAEAISGWMLAGLFLNSWSRVRKPTKRQTSHIRAVTRLRRRPRTAPDGLTP